MSKSRLQIEEKYLGEIQFEEILILLLSSNLTKNDSMPLVFTMQQKGMNYGLQ